MSESIKVIQSEIDWCKKNHGYKTPEYEEGFVAGLEQAKYLVRQAETDVAWERIKLR